MYGKLKLPDTTPYLGINLFTKRVGGRLLGYLVAHATFTATLMGKLPFYPGIFLTIIVASLLLCTIDLNHTDCTATH